jgi:hypothetical protein
MASNQQSISGKRKLPIYSGWWTLRGEAREAAKLAATPFEDENNRRAMMGNPPRSNSEIRRSLLHLIQKAKQI